MLPISNSISCPVIYLLLLFTSHFPEFYKTNYFTFNKLYLKRKFPTINSFCRVLLCTSFWGSSIYSQNFQGNNNFGNCQTSCQYPSINKTSANLTWLHSSIYTLLYTKNGKLSLAYRMVLKNVPSHASTIGIWCCSYKVKKKSELIYNKTFFFQKKLYFH